MHAHDFVRALAIVMGVAAVTTVLFQRLRQPVVLENALGLEAQLARTALLLGAALISVPFCVGIFELARRLGLLLAERALPAGRVDFAAAPRRALVVTLQLACVLLVGAPMVAITQPFLPGLQGALVLLLLVIALAVGFWRSATNLEGHVRAGAQAIMEVLSAQSKTKTLESEWLLKLHAMLPGIGEPEAFRLKAASHSVGKSLAQLDLRGVTGASVLAIQRGEEAVLMPTAQEVLRADDVLALAGTSEAIDAAKSVLSAAPQQQGAPTRSWELTPNRWW